MAAKRILELTTPASLGLPPRVSEGLTAYFHAGALDSAQLKAGKARQIASCFTADATLNTAAGEKLVGREAVERFFSAPMNPVMQAGFVPKPDWETACVLPDKHGVAIQVILSTPAIDIRVADWFYFTKEGMLSRMDILRVVQNVPVSAIVDKPVKKD
jgi:hypothetical protein